MHRNPALQIQDHVYELGLGKKLPQKYNLPSVQCIKND